MLHAPHCARRGAIHPIVKVTDIAKLLLRLIDRNQYSGASFAAGLNCMCVTALMYLDRGMNDFVMLRKLFANALWR